MGNDEHGPAYPEPYHGETPQCRVCGSLGDMETWCMRDNCPGRNPLPSHEKYHEWDPPPYKPNTSAAFLTGIIVGAALALLLVFTAQAHAFDHGFDPYDPTTKWFGQLLRHDKMPEPCCGKADAYAADTYNRNPDGSYDVTITDGAAVTFPDGTERPEIENGSVVHVPWNKINPPSETMSNPTGHAWLFVSVQRDYTGGQPNGVPTPKPGLEYCFAPLPEGS